MVHSRVTWKAAVRMALETYSRAQGTVQIDRQAFLTDQLSAIVRQVASVGKTPQQTVSRVLQELRDEGSLYFSSAGKYVLAARSLDVLRDEAPQDVLDVMAARSGLLFDDVTVSDSIGQSRIRKGVKALRQATLSNYENACALCDVSDSQLLVTSHIARWSDNSNARGLLSNTVCLCGLHDCLFEHGKFSLSDSYDMLVRPDIQSHSIRTWLSTCSGKFKLARVPPAREFLLAHRQRTGIC